MGAAATADCLNIIVGPTAAGKSALALRLAEERHLAIVSADSRQVYRGFDIGTAKPTADERMKVPHYGIDILAPTARYSAHQWAEDSRDWCDTIAGSERRPLIVGGTGFYVRALTSPLDAVPVLDADRRAALATVLDALSVDELRRWCARLDPTRAHLGRTQHLRAVETTLLAGTRISEAPARPPAQTVEVPMSGPLAVSASPRAARYLVVDPGTALAARIESRVHAMWQAGWLEEVQALVRVVPPDAPAWRATGYAVIREVERGTMSVAEALQQVIIDTRQYAKRQRTWNRHQLPQQHVTVVDSTAPDAWAQVSRWWDAQDGIKA